MPSTPANNGGGQSSSESHGVFGHQGSLAHGNFFYKLKPRTADRFENELHLLSLLTERRQNGDPMSSFAPDFHGLVEMGGQQYFKLQHLLEQFEDAHIMDVKMGVRCHTEDEIKNTKPRSDLFERMMRMKSDMLTADEIAAGSITKARWMTLRDQMSSTKTLGFRVDALHTPSEHKTAFDSELFRLRTDDEVVDVLRSFLPYAAECVDSTPRQIACAVLKRLEGLECGLQNSPLFAKHEFIGSTLLFVADKRGRSGVWMIDFGVTLPCDKALKHNVQWEPGNHEDGYLIGLANLIRLWKRIIAEDTWL